VYEPLPKDDARILRVLKLASGHTSSPLVGKLELSACLPATDNSHHTGKEDVDQNSKQTAPEASDDLKLEDDQELVDYEALSYCWGDPTKCTSITLNGARFGISANLEAALLHLRKPDTERVVWIDAICINQEDDTEKGREVNRMRDIYFGAKQVVVWLGPEDDTDSGKAIDFAEDIYKTFRGEHFEGEGAFDWLGDTGRTQVVQESGLIDDSSRAEDWRALHALLSRPWFGRAWTMQELVVAKGSVVMCGERSVRWEVLELAMQVACENYQAAHMLIMQQTQKYYVWPPHLVELIERLVRARQDFRERGDDRKDAVHVRYRTGNVFSFQRAGGASELLASNMPRGCLLAHDKIYSVLGVLPPPLRDAIKPDYSVSARTVYKRAARACIETTGWLNIICHSHYSPWYPSDHPSWLPDFTRMSRSGPSIFAERNRAHVMPPNEVSRETAARVSFSDDLSTLTAAGFVVAVVRQSGFERAVFPRMSEKSRFMSLATAKDINKWRHDSYPSDPDFHYIPKTGGGITYTYKPAGTGFEDEDEDEDGGDEEEVEWLESDPNYWEGEFEEDFRKLFFVEKKNSGSGPSSSKLDDENVTYKEEADKPADDDDDASEGASGQPFHPSQYFGTDVLDHFLGRLKAITKEWSKREDANLEYDTATGKVKLKSGARPVTIDAVLESLGQGERGKQQRRRYLETDEASFRWLFTKVQGHLHSRTIFTTVDDETGEPALGIGPDFAKQGDLVCVLLGCDAPVLLRRVVAEKDGKKEETFKFVGEAHVPELMKGQGMDGLEKGKYNLVDFELK